MVCEQPTEVGACCESEGKVREENGSTGSDFIHKREKTLCLTKCEEDTIGRIEHNDRIILARFFFKTLVEILGLRLAC